MTKNEMPIVVINNTQTGETISRPMTDEEYSVFLIDKETDFASKN